MTVDVFIEKWRASGASERSNYALFFADLTAVLGVPPPDPATGSPERDGYTVDRTVKLESGATNYVDLYKRGCFVLEAKQGSDAPDGERSALGLDELNRRRGTARRGTRAWETAMTKARSQALRYARALPASDGWPPFLVVCDVGHCFDLYADFSGQGKAYVPFPDQQTYRVMLGDLTDDAVRERLRLVWADPVALDPQRRSVQATKELASKLARLARSLEESGNAAADVADFLMRCLFTMFAEDVRLLPDRALTDLLTRYRSDPATAPKALRSLWESMRTGGFSGVIGADVRHFNGPLFAEPTSPALTEAQIDLLLEASKADWTDVEPAIFGTLVEQALDPVERHRLGAHYTPRAYVERLVLPTVIEPLREEWEAAQTAAALRESSGDVAGARDEVAAFHRRLCSVRVLDPACGTGNFLYVTLEHLKRLEGEVTDVLAQYPGQQTLDMTGGYTVSPAQLLGVELNPRAASVAEVVLWIGYLQWHFRTFGSADRLDAPLLRDYGNIENRDAVLSEDGTPASWPDAAFIVGNPPFLGKGEPMRTAFGQPYLDALTKAYPDVPASADFVMYWWEKAARAVRAGRTERFGLITTNSLTQTFNRRVVERHIGAAAGPLSLAFAVPDHPWVDTANGAAVRVAMTVAARADRIDADAGRLAAVTIQTSTRTGVAFAETVGRIHADLSTGANVTEARPLAANEGLSSFGVMLAGRGFVLTPDEAVRLGRTDETEGHVRLLLNGRDLASPARERYVVDFFGHTADEARERFPDAYDHLLRTVKPERDTNNRKAIRENWWLFGEKRPALRRALAGLTRYIATPETAKHRLFQFLPVAVLPEHKIIAIALDDAYHLGVLSSSVHTEWALAAGGRLGVGNDPVYNTTRCFQPFPFPVATPEQAETIRTLGEAIDAHRKSRQALHPDLGLTDLYNAVEALRAGRALTAKEESAAKTGLARTLLDLHRRLDRSVLDTYGWADLDAEAAGFVPSVLDRLVALNAERAAEEERGLVRYLRPAFQNPDAGDQAGFEMGPTTAKKVVKSARAPWPKSMAERAVAVRRAVGRMDRAALPSELAATFSRARETEVADVLDALEALGLVGRDPAGRFSA